MRFKICSLFILLLGLSHQANAIDRQEVKLEKKIFPVTGKLEGLSNIFFGPLKDSRFQYPQDWKAIEIAPVIDNKAFLPIHALRYKNSSGLIQYIVDTDGDLDFRKERPLQFQQNDTLQIADAVLTIQPIDKKETAQQVNYQIILSSDGYTYARNSEFRQGVIRFGNLSFSVFLRPRFRDTPLYNLSSAIICLIDRDRDGSFSSTWRLSADGKISQTEELDIGSPFILEGRKLRVVKLATDGTLMTIEATDERTAISPGFKAPDFTLASIDKKVFKLNQLGGKIVFLEFWSVSCPFCKQILPQVNTLIKSKAGNDFVALAIAREENLEEIETYLKQHPRNANVVLNEKATWQKYDNPGITPTFYLIDQQGVVRFLGYGASPEQLRIIERLIEELRSK